LADVSLTRTVRRVVTRGLPPAPVKAPRGICRQARPGVLDRAAGLWPRARPARAADPPARPPRRPSSAAWASTRDSPLTRARHAYRSSSRCTDCPAAPRCWKRGQLGEHAASLVRQLEHRLDSMGALAHAPGAVGLRPSGRPLRHRALVRARSSGR